MSIPIGFDPASGNIIITGNSTFPARSLVAIVSDTLPETILIQDTGGRGEQSLTWGDVTSLDGSYAPASMADALAYLRAEFAKAPVSGSPERNYALPPYAGQPVFPISPEPVDVNTVTLLINGVAYAPPDIAASLLSVTWQGPFPLDPTDALRVVYF